MILYGHTKLDQIKNKVIREKVVVAPFEDMMQTAKLR